MNNQHINGYLGGLTCCALILLCVHIAIQHENERRALPLEISKAPWKSLFYEGKKLEKDKLKKVSSKNFINFNWKGKNPEEEIDGGNFSAKFQSCILADKKQQIYFKIMSDDGVRIYIDSKLVFESWKEQVLKDGKFSYTFEQGLHSILIEYYQTGGPSQLKLFAGAHKKKLKKIPVNEKIILEDDFAQKSPCYLV